MAHEHAEYDDDREETRLPDGRTWVTCWNCGGEVMVDHDCGEDTCCCLYPEDNVPCDICNGRGGWFRKDGE